jgi:hypothetical protein
LHICSDVSEALHDLLANSELEQPDDAILVDIHLGIETGWDYTEQLKTHAVLSKFRYLFLARPSTMRMKKKQKLSLRTLLYSQNPLAKRLYPK